MEGYKITLEEKKRILETLDQPILKRVDDEGEIDKEVLNTSELGQTVNRVQEIHKLAAPEYWNHCPTLENAVDIASRGTTATQMTDEKWWHGPSFPKKPPNEWHSLTTFKLPEEIDQ